MFAALQPEPDIRGANYFYKPNDRFVWVPFGIRFIAPLYLNRIEFSGGGGGLYENYFLSNPTRAFWLQSRDGWGGYFVGSAAVALDRRKRFWLGATPRWFLANPRYERDRWFQITGELSFRLRPISALLAVQRPQGVGPGGAAGRQAAGQKRNGREPAECPGIGGGTSRSASRYGNGFRIRAWIALKTAVLAPIPRASIKMRVVESAGALRICRKL